MSLLQFNPVFLLLLIAATSARREVVVEKGEGLTLSCKVNPLPNMNRGCYWLHSGQVTHFNSSVPCAISIEHVSAWDYGNWTCIVPGQPVNDVTFLWVRDSTIVLFVHPDGRTEDPFHDNHTAKANDNGIIHVICGVIWSYSPPSRLEFKVDDEYVESKHVLKVRRAPNDGDFVSTRRLDLKFSLDKFPIPYKNVTCLLSYAYEDDAFNKTVQFGIGYNVTDVTLKSLVPQVFVGEAQEILALRCSAFGNPIPDFYVFYRIDPETETAEPVDGDSIGIFNITEPGDYYCSVGYSIELHLEQDFMWASKNWKRSPLITVEKDAASENKKRVSIGSSVTLECQLEPEAKICVWSHGEMNVFNGNKHGKNTGYRTEGEPSEGQCNLRIKKFREEDKGVWYCLISEKNTKAYYLMSEGISQYKTSLLFTLGLPSIVYICLYSFWV